MGDEKMNKNLHLAPTDILDALVLSRRPQLTKLEQVICQRVPADSLDHPENAIVLEQLDPQPTAVALLQLRVELMLDDLIK
jgi:hypothetical protein